MIRRLPVVTRAHLHAWRGHAQRTRARLGAARRRGQVTSALFIVVGLAGLLLGAWTVGVWCLGLAAMAEAGGLLYVGLNRDDGEEVPVRGSRTVPEVLADEAIRE